MVRAVARDEVHERRGMENTQTSSPQLTAQTHSLTQTTFGPSIPRASVRERLIHLTRSSQAYAKHCFVSPRQSRPKKRFQRLFSRRRAGLARQRRVRSRSSRKKKAHHRTKGQRQNDGPKQKGSLWLKRITAPWEPGLAPDRTPRGPLLA